jgi:hypothetical protein
MPMNLETAVEATNANVHAVLMAEASGQLQFPGSTSHGSR